MAETARQRGSAVRHVEPDGAALIVGSQLRFRVAVARPGCVLLTARGGRSHSADDAEAERLMLRELDAELERAGSLIVFADLRQTSRMTAESREFAAEWMNRNKGRLRNSHVLVASKLLEMAMSIVAMLVGGGILKVYSHPQAFLAAVRVEAPGVRVLPELD